MNRIAALLLALVAALLLTVTPATASRPGVTPTSDCVSGWEFENLQQGTPRAEAERFLDGPGRGPTRQLRQYRSCANTWAHAQVHVKYVQGRVFSVMGMRINSGGHLLVPAATS